MCTTVVFARFWLLFFFSSPGGWVKKKLKLPHFALRFSLPVITYQVLRSSRNSSVGKHSRLFSALPPTFRDLHFYREKTSTRCSLVYSRCITLTPTIRDALRSWALFFCSKSHHVLQDRQHSRVKPLHLLLILIVDKPLG